MPNTLHSVVLRAEYIDPISKKETTSETLPLEFNTAPMYDWQISSFVENETSYEITISVNDPSAIVNSVNTTIIAKDSEGVITNYYNYEFTKTSTGPMSVYTASITKPSSAKYDIEIYLWKNFASKYYQEIIYTLSVQLYICNEVKIMEKERKVTKPARKGLVRMIVVLSIIAAVFIFAIIFGTVPGLAATPFGVFVNTTVGKFFNLAAFFTNNALALLETVVIIFFVWALNEIAKMIIDLLIRKFTNKSTIWIIIRSVFKYGSVIVGVFLILSAWGVQTPTLLAGAGILGLALSFGAQSLIEDVISGLFIIFEKQFQVDDIIQVHGFRGKVTEIGVRTTTLIDVNGDVLVINNSDLRQTINTSANLSPAICDISISYSENIEKVEKVILANIDELKKKIPDIVEGPFYRGVQSLSDSAVVIRMYAKTDELKKYQVTRDMNKEMKLLFDRNGIQIPFNQIVVHYEDDKEEKH